MVSVLRDPAQSLTGRPILAEQKMPDGGVWKNLVSEDKAKPAETLAEFRGNYKYNLVDKNVLDRDGKAVVKRSAERYLRAIGQ